MTGFCLRALKNHFLENLKQELPQLRPDKRLQITQSYHWLNAIQRARLGRPSGFTVLCLVVFHTGRSVLIQLEKHPTQSTDLPDE
jgi:hypothetical protein